MTSKLGILGFPLEHSVSPVFQQAALDYLGIDAVYLAWPVAPAHLTDKVRELRDTGVLGANVTIPHKEHVMGLLDEVNGVAEKIGSVNTILNRRGVLGGYNTDAEGFMRGIRGDARFDPRNKKVALLGAGGASRAVAYGLAEASVKHILVINRTEERAYALVKDLNKHCSGVPIEIAKRLNAGYDYDLLVNCTPVGMKGGEMEGRLPLPRELIRRGALICDIIYNPLETPLLREAKLIGAETLGGLPMLIYQGAIAFELWTGREAPIKVMFAAARRALS